MRLIKEMIKDNDEQGLHSILGISAIIGMVLALIVLSLIFVPKLLLWIFIIIFTLLLFFVAGYCVIELIYSIGIAYDKKKELKNQADNTK